MHGRPPKEGLGVDAMAPGTKGRRSQRVRRRWMPLGAVLVGLPLGMVLTRSALFRGPPRPPQSLPAAALVDLHVHTAGIGSGGSGCFVTTELQHSYKFGIYLQAFGVTREEVEREGDGLLIRRISERLARSDRVGAAVILALDGVVDPASGELDLTRTEVHVPSEFVSRETARYTNLLYGASINPHRRDALERLDRAAAEGAVLVKWIPSIMQIDPSDERLLPFYDRMRHHGLPLLSHTGAERSFTRADDSLSDPERLRLPLRRGVVVIAAHVASTGSNGGEPDLERLARLMTEFPNLYADISSLTQANKLAYLRPALTRPEFAGRLCHGSDFPLMNTALVSPWFFPLDLTTSQMEALAAITNPWDRDVALKQALGVPPDVFQRSAALLKRAVARPAPSHH